MRGITNVQKQNNSAKYWDFLRSVSIDQPQFMDKAFAELQAKGIPPHICRFLMFFLVDFESKLTYWRSLDGYDYPYTSRLEFILSLTKVFELVNVHILLMHCPAGDVIGINDKSPTGRIIGTFIKSIGEGLFMMSDLIF